MTAETHHDSQPGRAVLRARGQVTLPAHVRMELGLRDGDDLIVTVDSGRVILTPATLVPRDQDWFWTPEWQAGERQVDAELAAGKPGQVFGSDEEFLATLAAGIDDPTVLR
ncbi:AbrB/MazE/SpoVT family DNA-binding domain-containing protein [Luedemannella helvata]|uniref:AbrB/MazE/SpoVT family DNA-binding domain-containing protein n=1 Tax=Luedemannella helvata TaxID=349315 RepID=A0ABN2K537_9ACTN